jgi:diamine N-acetyltransferase
MIPLSGKNIRLRAIEPSDLDVLFEWENDPENWLVSNTSAPFSRHTLRTYIDNAHQDIYQARQLRLMIDRQDPATGNPVTVGIIDLFEFDPLHLRAGVGILIARKGDRMKGLASEALALLVDFAFHNLHLHQLFCNVSEDNAASLRLFKKHGFTEAGRKKDWIRSRDKWLDVYLLQKINPESG